MSGLLLALGLLTIPASELPVSNQVECPGMTTIAMNECAASDVADARARMEKRTHVIWLNWLLYMDESSPILPEPLPTPDSNTETRGS